MRTYKSAKSWREEHPAVRMIILMSPQGQTVNWHAGTPEPEGRYSLLGVIE